MNTALWMIYDAFVMPSGLINHSVIICFIAFAMVRNDRAEWKALLSKIFGKKSLDEEKEVEKINSEVEK